MLQVVDDPSNKTKRDLGAEEEFGMHGPQPPLEPGMWRIPYFNARCHLPSCPLLVPLPILPVRPVTTMAGNSTIGAPCADYTLESPGGSSVSYQALSRH